MSVVEGDSLVVDFDCELVGYASFGFSSHAFDASTFAAGPFPVG
jgi:hypothetical protein